MHLFFNCHKKSPQRILVGEEILRRVSIERSKAPCREIVLPFLANVNNGKKVGKARPNQCGDRNPQGNSGVQKKINN
jgi:hypothetical protein